MMSYGWKYTYHDTHIGQKRGRHSGNQKVLLTGTQWKVACLDTLVLQMNVISCKCDFQFIQTLECRGDADKGEFCQQSRTNMVLEIYTNMI